MRSASHRSYGNYIHLFSLLSAVWITPALSLVLCQTIHNLPLSAASHARTNHCHRALSDRAAAWGSGEITKTSVGVAFSLFSCCSKKKPLMQLFWTLVQLKQNTLDYQCQIAWKLSSFTWALSTSLSYPTMGMAKICKPSHRGNLTSMQLISCFMPVWKEKEVKKEISEGGE